jgi:dolichyl-phosphate beta-glucosyltransferase
MNENSPPQPKGDLTTWLRDRAVSGHDEPEISVIIPAFNEERRLPPTLIDIIDLLDTRSTPYEVIVVDDGSTDGTSDVVRKFERIRPHVRLLRLPVNGGKGNAVRTGMLNARGRWLIFTDADGATPFIEFERLMKAVNEGADIAIGSRALYSQETTVKTVWYRRILGRIFNGTVNLVLLPRIADTQCGFKLFTARTAREIFARQTARRFGFDVEILYIARKLGFSIVEVPINWTNVPGSKVNLIVDAAQMLLDVLRFRWRHRQLQPAPQPTKPVDISSGNAAS